MSSTEYFFFNPSLKYILLGSRLCQIRLIILLRIGQFNIIFVHHMIYRLLQYYHIMVIYKRRTYCNQLSNHFAPQTFIKIMLHNK